VRGRRSVSFLARRLLCYTVRMRESDVATKQARIRIAVPFHYGWVVVGLTFLVTLMAAATRSAPSVLIHPLEAEFGWSRAAIAAAASLNLLLYGLAAPVGGWLIDRVGPRGVILGSLSGMVAGVTGAIFVRELWQLIFLWGIVLGIATGMTPSLGASVASRWFVSRRGLALGIMSNANAAGQVIFLPLLMAVIVSNGWRSSLLVVVAASVFLLPAILLSMRDDPAEVGLQPYGSGQGDVYQPTQGAYTSREFHSVGTLSDVLPTSTFWLLSGCFFVCGVTANGLIGTHLIPHAIERGIPQVTAAVAVGIMGGASFVGTTFAGWLVDRVDPRKVLSAAYALRASSLFVLPFVSESWGLFVFAVMYGLDWFATGPATTAILAHSFGQQRIGTLFGLVFVFHQVGAALAAVAGGWARMQFGDYRYAFLVGAIMGLVAAALALTIRMNGRQAPPIPATAELARA
jgi:MFS family permease